MDQQAFEKLVVDVAKHYDTPDALLADRELTRDQKLKLLQQWEYDLQLLQVATEENMTGDTPPGDNAERIRHVHAAVESLGAEFNAEKSGAAKTGAGITEKAKT